MRINVFHVHIDKVVIVLVGDEYEWCLDVFQSVLWKEAFPLIVFVEIF